MTGTESVAPRQMNTFDCLDFMLAYWREVDEDLNAVAGELDRYQARHEDAAEGYRDLARDYAHDIVLEADEWSTEWVKRAKHVLSTAV